MDATNKERDNDRKLRRFGSLGCLTVIVVLAIGGWFAVRAVSSAVCTSYNSISNDFCDEWRYQSPPEDALPLPSGWRIEWTQLSCGSGGCPTRKYIVRPELTTESTARYVERIDELGWRRGEGFSARRGDLLLRAENPATGNSRSLIPRRFRSSEFVYVSLHVCGEAISCD